MDNNIPKWNPSPEDYNTAPKPPKDEKPKKKWLIPLILVIAVMVAAIVIGVIIGMNKTRKAVDAERKAQIAADQETQAKEEKEVAASKPVSSVNSSGIVLTDVSGIVDDVIPSVVSITSRTIVEQYEDYFSYFFGGRRRGSTKEPETKEVESGIGSGTIIQANDEELLILTSYHVVEGCSSLYVTFTDSESVDGIVKAASADTDIAIVSVPMGDIPEETIDSIRVATLSTDSVKVGEGLIVIGNALGYGISVTTGIVSATERIITVDDKTLIVTQTDAAINAGNSGGCVLNSKGEIVGISEAKITIDNVEGMCYAIPIDINSGLIQDLLEAKSDDGPAMKDKETAYLGIQGRDITSQNAQKYDMPEGIYVAGVVKGYGAKDAGLQEGDIITALNKVSTKTMAELQAQLTRYSAGDVVTITFMREGEDGYEKMTTDVTLSGGELG